MILAAQRQTIRTVTYALQSKSAAAAPSAAVLTMMNIRKRGYHEISYSETGDPAKVLQYHRCEDEEYTIPSIEGHDVLVAMHEAPWNPADQNTVQGKYPSPLKNPPPQYPSVREGGDWKVVGSEGWGRVVQNNNANNNTQLLKPGTFVTMGQNGMGTFRSSLWLPESALIPVDRGAELETKLGPAASTLFQLGGTAFRMLHDFETSSENTTVLQNAGNSSVGFMISQLAAAEQIPVVSLVRRGSKTDDEFAQLENHLTQDQTNTTTVVAEEDLINDKQALKELQSSLKQTPARLAINAVGGPSADVLLKTLAPGGTMITYGGMSMKPVTVATPQLIFKDVKVKGYWHSRWMVQHFVKDKKKMVDDLVSAVLDKGVQCPPVQMFRLSQIHEALAFDAKQSQEVFRKKVVFDCGAPSS